MSFLRLLSPRPAESSSSRTVASPITLALHVPSYGAIYLSSNPDPLHERSAPGDATAPADDVPLRGELEVVVPDKLGRRRCKAITVGMKTVSRLDLGPGRMGEEDTIFERKVEIIAGDADGIWLEPGRQPFAFTIILPQSLALHDWHPNARVTHTLYAELVGEQLPSRPARSRPSSRPGSRASSKPGSRSGSPSLRPSRAISAAHSRSGSPRSSSPAHGMPGLADNLESLSITRQELPRAPPYELAKAGIFPPSVQDDWVKGTIEANRILMCIWNPNPSGGITALDELASGVVDGLGVYDIRLLSDCWTVCAMMQASLRFPTLGPKTTVFHIRVSLAQTHTITSPREDPAVAKPITSTRTFPIIEEGSRPPAGHVHPSAELSAIWRGIEAAGKDEGELKVDASGRLPNDDHARPSTPPMTITPVKVTHALVTEVYFSVYGEDQSGKPMLRPGNGGLRVLKVKKEVVLPSCAFIPQNVELPSYEQTLSANGCPHQAPEYSGSRKMHPGWESDAEISKGKGPKDCPLCLAHILPRGTPGWKNCACGQKLENMEERIRRMDEEDRRARWERELSMGNKELAERGRQRTVE